MIIDRSSVQWIIENIKDAAGNKFKMVQNLTFVSNGGVHWRVKLVRHGCMPFLDFYIEPVQCLQPMNTLISVEFISQKDGFKNKEEVFSHSFTPGAFSCRRKCIISVEEFLGGYINNQSCTLRVSLTAVTHGPKVAGSDKVPGNVKNIADSAGTESGIVSENENVKSIAGTAGKNIAGTARSESGIVPENVKNIAGTSGSESVIVHIAGTAENLKNIAGTAGSESGIVSEKVKSIAGTTGKNIAGTARSESGIVPENVKNVAGTAGSESGIVPENVKNVAGTAGSESVIVHIAGTAENVKNIAGSESGIVSENVKNIAGTPGNVKNVAGTGVKPEASHSVDIGQSVQKSDVETRSAQILSCFGFETINCLQEAFKRYPLFQQELVQFYEYNEMAKNTGRWGYIVSILADLLMFLQQTKWAETGSEKNYNLCASTFHKIENEAPKLAAYFAEKVQKVLNVSKLLCSKVKIAKMEYELSKSKNEAAALENLAGEFDLERVIDM